MFLFPNLFIPADYNLPPTLYSLLDAMANFDNDEKVKIKDLASATHEKVFDFTYPLSTHINKDDFEILILKHYLMRRIGYDTMTAFKIALDSKLNEVMPMYNKLFDMLYEWDLFDDVETETRSVSDTRNTTVNSTLNQISSTNNTSDRRFSELPQNKLSDLRDGNYVTDYNYDTDTSSLSSTNAGNTTSSEGGNLIESIARDKANKMNIYKEFKENRESIYTMLFKDLDSLFYGLC